MIRVLELFPCGITDGRSAAVPALARRSTDKNYAAGTVRSSGGGCRGDYAFGQIRASAAPSTVTKIEPDDSVNRRSRHCAGNANDRPSPHVICDAATQTVLPPSVTEVLCVPSTSLAALNHAL